MSSWEALVELDRDRPGLAEQMVAGLRTAIVTGRLAPGTRLPSSRGLAADLGLSRGVVVDAYEQLTAEGRLVARRGSGTRVAAVVGASAAGDAGSADTDGPTGHWELGPVPLRPGVPDLGLFPRAQWRRAYERALDRARDRDLDYGEPAGALRLRAELASYLGRVRAARVDPDALLVTTGAAQAFSLLAAVLAARGETGFGIEDPGSAAIRGHLTAHGLRPVPIPVDHDGLDVAALSRTGVRAVVVTPAHQFPTGVVLAPDRRAALVAWAARTGGLIIEDDYDAEFRYDRDPVGCLQGLAPERVAHIGSTSKALAPAMRLGWLTVPSRLRGPVLAAKAAADLCGPVLEQLAFAELLATGGYDRHLRRARRGYRQRRDALVAAVRRHLPTLRISGIAAGLHLVLELPEGVDDVALARAAHRAGLAPVPLSRLRQPPTASAALTAPAALTALTAPTAGEAPVAPEASRNGKAGDPPPGRSGLVLGYAASTPDELDRAVHTLAALIA